MTVRAYKIEDGVVTNGLVGTADWATKTYGGFWVETDIKAWIGGTWDETDGFQPPTATDPPVE